jgi:hypothetical protein
VVAPGSSAPSPVLDSGLKLPRSDAGKRCGCGGARCREAHASASRRRGRLCGRRSRRGHWHARGRSVVRARFLRRAGGAGPAAPHPRPRSVAVWPTLAARLLCGAPGCRRDAPPPVLPQRHAAAAPPRHAMPRVPTRRPRHRRARAARLCAPAAACVRGRRAAAGVRACRAARLLAIPHRTYSRARHTGHRRRLPRPARPCRGRHWALRIPSVRRHAAPRPRRSLPAAARHRVLGRCSRGHQQAAAREGVRALRAHPCATATTGAGARPDLGVGHAPVHVPHHRPGWVCRSGGSRRGNTCHPRHAAGSRCSCPCPAVAVSDRRATDDPGR